MAFLAVALGGGLGAVCRYSISLLPYKGAFPFLTLFTNLIGAFAIGCITGVVLSKKDVSANWILFLKTGVCGGFTTFSTFSLEAYELLEAGKVISGGAYICASVLLCLIGVALGKSVTVKLMGAM